MTVEGGARGATLPDLLDTLAHGRGADTAFLDRGMPVTYAALAAESRRVARGFADLGVGRGDVVAIWLPNVPAWIAAFFACARLGAIALATNTRFRSAEMADIIGRSGAKLLVYWPAFRGIDFDGILRETDRAAFGGLAGIVAYDEARGAALPVVHGVPAYRYRDLAARPPLERDDASPEAGCVIYTTSGTTKAPKFVLHPQRTIATHMRDIAQRFGYTLPGSVGLSVLPLCGVYGFATAMAPLLAGVPFPMEPVFEPARTLELIRAHRVTGTNLTGDMIPRLLAESRDRADFASLRFIGCGSGSVLHAPAAAAHGLRVTGLYGSSEVQALFSHNDEIDAIDVRSLGGGRPVSGLAQVRARDTATGKILPHGESGELEIRAPSVFREYFLNAEATREAFTDDGFFRTGDLGASLADGRFLYQARMGDALRLSGFLVSPPQIEEVVLEHPSVSACQVVGVEEAAGAKPYAFVILRPGAAFDERSLAEHCRNRMARYKVPARFVALDEFPVTLSANGTKVQKARLREMAQALARTGGMA